MSQFTSVASYWPQLLLNLFLGGATGGIRAIWNTISFVVSNARSIVDLLRAIASGLGAASNSPTAVGTAILTALRRLTRLLFGFLERQLNLSSLLMRIRQAIQRLAQWVAMQIGRILNVFRRGRSGARGCPVRPGTGTPPMGNRPPARSGSCFATGEYWITGNGHEVAIEHEWLGSRAQTLFTHEAREVPHGRAKWIDPARTYRLHLRMECADKQHIEAVLLRHEQWLKGRQAKVGAWIYLEMPEMGMQGYAKVLAIGPCPAGWHCF